MNKVNISKLLVLLLIIFSIQSTIYAEKSKTNIVYDYDCLSANTKIRFFNESNHTPIISEYSYKEIEANENRLNITFQTLSGKIKIFDGPFDSSPTILNQTFKKTNYQNFVFTQKKTYLVKIDFDGNFTSYEEKYFNDPYCENTPAIVTLPPQENTSISEDNSSLEDNQTTNLSATNKDNVQQDNNEIPQETLQTQEQEEIVYEIQTTKEGNLNTYIGIGIVAIIFLFIIVYIISKKNHEKKIHYHDSRNTTTTTQNNTHVEVLTNYNDTLEHTKAYLREHKAKYSKDQLYRALEQANTPKDIIDKAIEEEF